MATPESPRRLGRGLDALLARKEPRAGVSTREGEEREREQSPPSDAPVSALQTLPLTSIRPNPYQPRHEFGEGELADLEASLKSNGLLQPITVRPAPNGDGYELIAGERRFRAARSLGWTEIAAVVRGSDDRAALTLALVENLQRADLDPIDEADGYQRLLDEFALSQQEVADVVGKDRSTVANSLRLRQLPASIRVLLQQKLLSAGHGRAMLPLGDEAVIEELAREVIATGMSVRDVERRVQAGRPPAPKSGVKSSEPARATSEQTAGTAESRRIEELLRRRLQTTVSLHLSAKDRGEVRIAFFSNDDLERVLTLLGVSING